VIVRADGSVSLLDFGIAKHLEDLAESGSHTRTALRLMTPLYAAPEQLTGGVVGMQTDVYALGVMLYELLTGRTPFEVTGLTPLLDRHTGRLPLRDYTPDAIFNKLDGVPVLFRQLGWS
jgi:serine/threonine protein kinase